MRYLCVGSLILSLGTALAHAQDVAFPCGSAEHLPECTVLIDQQLIPSLEDRADDALKLMLQGKWRAFVKTGPHEFADDTKTFTLAPVCPPAKLGLLKSDLHCKDMSKQVVAGTETRSCGEHSYIFTGMPGKPWSSYLKDKPERTSLEPNNYSGLLAVIYGHYVQEQIDLLKTSRKIKVEPNPTCKADKILDIINNQEMDPSAKPPVRGLRKLIEQQQLKVAANQATDCKFEKLDMNNESSSMTACPSQPYVKSALVGLQKAFLGLALCEASRKAIKEWKEYRSKILSEPNGLLGVQSASDSAGGRTPSSVNQIYKNEKYDQYWANLVQQKWPLAKKGCQ